MQARREKTSLAPAEIIYVKAHEQFTGGNPSRCRRRALWKPLLVGCGPTIRRGLQTDNDETAYNYVYSLPVPSDARWLFSPSVFVNYATPTVTCFVLAYFLGCCMILRVSNGIKQWWFGYGYVTPYMKIIVDNLFDQLERYIFHFNYCKPNC